MGCPANANAPKSAPAGRERPAPASSVASGTAGTQEVSMDLGLDGTRAVVTGGSRGLGLAIADALAREGAWVGLIARGPDDLADAAEKVGRHGRPVVTVVADVTDPEALGTAVDEVAGELGGL